MPKGQYKTQLDILIKTTFTCILLIIYLALQRFFFSPTKVQDLFFYGPSDSINDIVTIFKYF